MTTWIYYKGYLISDSRRVKCFEDSSGKTIRIEVASETERKIFKNKKNKFLSFSGSYEVLQRLKSKNFFLRFHIFFYKYDSKLRDTIVATFERKNNRISSNIYHALIFRFLFLSIIYCRLNEKYDFRDSSTGFLISGSGKRYAYDFMIQHENKDFLISDEYKILSNSFDFEELKLPIGAIIHASKNDEFTNANIRIQKI